MNLVFMGSPVEAIECLKVILANQHSWGVNLTSVVSQPARAAGRKRVMLDPPVAEFAKKEGILTLQPEMARDESFLAQLRQLNPDIIVTAAYGQILSERFLEIPNRATINIHPSLLPMYRGATPVQSALLNGESRSGVTVLFTVKKLDAGNIVVQEPYDFGPKMTAGELLPILFKIGGGLLEHAIEKLRDKSFEGEPQDEDIATYCGKFSKDDGLIDWTNNAGTLLNHYRAFTPWPGMFTFLNGVRVRILEMIVSDSNLVLSPGCFELIEGRLLVGTGGGIIEIKRLMRAGSKESDGKSFMNGLRSDVSKMFVNNESGEV